MMGNTKVIKISQFSGLLGFLIVFLAACGGDPRNDYSVSDIPEQTSLRRFEQDMLGIKGADPSLAIQALKAKYPRFFPFYTEEIMQWPKEQVGKNIQVLNQNQIVADLMDTINMVFGDFQDEYSILEKGFKRFYHHLPLAPTPNIVTTITEFSYPTATDDSLLIISLEMFLGEDYPYYPGFGLPEYKIRRMNKQHLPVFAMNAWYDQQLGNIPRGKRFLDAMIVEGKRLYFLDLMYPEMADSLKTYWTGDQLDWLERNEGQMWTYYIEKDYLYNTDVVEYSNLMADAPFTSAEDVPAESAPRIGVYTGWRIVKQYMDEHPEVSLPDLLMNPNADEILKGASYRPD